MAVTVSRQIPDGLDVKIKKNDTGWGNQAAWWQWVKDETRREITNRELRVLEAAEQADLEIKRQAILNDSSAAD